MPKRHDRVVVFVDWQNVFSRARALFHRGRRHVRAVDGQIDPVKLAELVGQRRRDRRRLNFVSSTPTWRHYLDRRDYMTIRDPEDYRAPL